MTATATPARPASILDARHRFATVGVLLIITIVAFEAMAVATVMPVAVTDLNGMALYGWAFTGFFITNVVGIVDAGVRSDRSGPVRVLLAGLVTFAVGLLVAGAATTMPVFVLGRAIQGYGGGGVIVAVYVLIARVYAEDLRPRVFAAISAAWVLPALIGPAAAGAVAEHLHWRWVFLAIAPVTVLGLALLLPVLRSVPEAPAGATSRRGGSWSGVRLAVGLAVLQASGQRLGWWSVPLAAIGLAVLLPPLVRLLPAGALRVRPGLPTTVALRGLLAASFFGAEAYLPLTLTEVHGFGATAAGLPLTVGAVGWAAGSFLQGRLAPRGLQARLLAVGFSVVALSVGTLSLVAVPRVTPWLALGLWGLGGLGIGMAMPVISVLTLAQSRVEEQGANSAALQVCDVTGSVVGIGAGGALVALAHGGTISFTAAVIVIDLVAAAVATLGAVVSRRAVVRG